MTNDAEFTPDQVIGFMNANGWEYAWRWGRDADVYRHRTGRRCLIRLNPEDDLYHHAIGQMLHQTSLATGRQCETLRRTLSGAFHSEDGL